MQSVNIKKSFKFTSYNQNIFMNQIIYIKGYTYFFNQNNPHIFNKIFPKNKNNFHEILKVFKNYQKSY